MFDKEMVHESFESNLLAEEVGESTNLHRDREREGERTVNFAVQNMSQQLYCR